MNAIITGLESQKRNFGANNTADGCEKRSFHSPMFRRDEARVLGFDLGVNLQRKRRVRFRNRFLLASERPC